MARYSEDIATQSSVSATTAGLQAMGSRQDGEAVGDADGEGEEPVQLGQGPLQRLGEGVAPLAAATTGTRPPPRSRSRSGSSRRRARAGARSWLWLDSDPLWTRQVSAPVAKGCDPLVVIADSVAIRVWGDGVGPRARPEVVALRHQVGVADRLVDLDLGPVAQHVDVGVVLDQPTAGPAAVARGLEHGVVPARASPTPQPPRTASRPAAAAPPVGPGPPRPAP